MCTVSFVNSNNKIIITSSRDEHKDRGNTAEPVCFELTHKKICFPKDEKSQGTWFGVSSKNEIMVLFNGGFQNHVRQPYYRKSRGIIFTDLLGSADVLAAWAAIDLTDIEPFSLVYFALQQLHKMTWTGAEKTLEALPLSQSYIWSSPTLYTPEQAAERQIWFAEKMSHTEQPTPQDMIDFHCLTQPENQEYGLRIRRSNGMQTQSISQAVFEQNIVTLDYLKINNSSPQQLERSHLTIENDDEN
jgi:uncharacterized protein with NRDE domain